MRSEETVGRGAAANRASAARTADLDRLLTRLRDFAATPPGRVLSVYVNRDPRQPGFRRGAWRTKLANALRTLQAPAASARSGGLDPDAALPEGLARAVLAAAADWALAPGRGTVHFRCEDPPLSETLHLPVSLATAASWQPRPDAAELQRARQAHPRFGIVVLQRAAARLIVSDLGQVARVEVVDLSPDMGDWRRYEGPAGLPDWTKTSHADEDRFAARSRRALAQRLADLQAALAPRAREEDWEGVVFVGAPPLAGELAKAEYPCPLLGTGLLPYNLADRSDDEILRRVYADVLGRPLDDSGGVMT
ncbi:MAG: hypothetical protein IRY95_07020 [Clostridia bacterium]|nr:hypothetical protein [Clostridia bacterium]